MDDLAPRDHDEKARRGIGRRRDEHREHLLARPGLELLRRACRDEPDGPPSGTRVLDQDDVAEEALLLAQHGPHDAAGRAVEPARERQALEQRVPAREKARADGALRQPADRGETGEEQQQAEAGDRERQRRIQEPAEQPVEALKDPPQHGGRDPDRRDHDESGDQVTPQCPYHSALAHCPITSRRIRSCVFHMRLRTRPAPSGWS